MAKIKHGGRAYSLEWLRGIAALVVLVWHFDIILMSNPPRPWSAYLSVDLFFILSGAVFCRAYEARLAAGWSFGRFAQARALRIWPLYLVGTAIGVASALITLVAVGAARWQYKGPLIDAALAFFMVPQVWSVGPLYNFNPPAWSLLSEAIVNVAYGLIGFRLSSRTLVLVSAVSFTLIGYGALANAAIGAGLDFGAFSEHGWIGIARAFASFPLGVVIYRMAIAGRLPRLRPPLTAVTLIYVCGIAERPTDPVINAIYAVVIVMLVWPILMVAVVQIEPDEKHVPLARWVGRLSYPLYAIHWPCFMVALSLIAVTGWDRTMTLVAAGGVSLLLAVTVAQRADAAIQGMVSRRLKLPRPAVTAAPPL